MRIKYDPDGLTSRVGEGTSWVLYHKATLADAIGMLRILSGDSMSPVVPVSDVNSDHRLGLAEVIQVLNELAQ